ncbi:hypothetical protein [Streptomyces sp. NPDC021224]|uniref:hypothetical protein n=1 Tax=unclassified Streptomyces TaxID=2593676 RepID=UPI00379AC0D3
MIPEAAARLSRRSVMAAAVAAVGTGCSAHTTGADGKGGARQAAVPGAAEQAGAARDSVELAGRYDAAVAAHPSLTARLAPLRDEVARHVEAFGGRLPAAPASPAAAAAATPAKALAALAAAERKLADARAAALLTVPGGLARLLASAAACGAGHAALLSGKAPETVRAGKDDQDGKGGHGTASDDGDEG